MSYRSLITNSQNRFLFYTQRLNQDSSVSLLLLGGILPNSFPIPCPHTQVMVLQEVWPYARESVTLNNPLLFFPSHVFKPKGLDH
jgi:hypothetical protein